MFLFHLQNNLTVVTEFFLLGFQGSRLFRYSLFLLFFVVFSATICGNLLIILLVSISRSLQTPMYFFISQLSISDILLTTDIVPKMLQLLVDNGGTITHADCFAQFYFFCVCEEFECFLLAVMSYDRYVAICNPLRYTSIVTNDLCVKLATMCLILGFLTSLVLTVSPSLLCFQVSIVDHFFCDLVPLLEHASSDTFIVHLEMHMIGSPTVLIPMAIIVVSYTYIVVSVLRIPSSTGRQKAFSTCSSHLIVVSIFYWTIFSVYVFPTKGQTSAMSKMVSLLYTVFTPLMNPIIYSLRNKDIKKAALDTFNKY